MAETSHSSNIRQLWPLLAVQDIDCSVEFYCNQLGFTLAGDDAKPDKQRGWCRLERGGSSIMLQQFRKEDGVTWGRGVSFYFICDDADVMYAELSARGLRLEAPRVAHYGMKQLFVPEPDGYTICFESRTEHWAG